MNFADRLINSCQEKNSYLMAGIDPQPELIPDFIIAAARQKHENATDFHREILFNYCNLILEGCQNHVGVIKPNIAFFEVFGLAGHQAYQQLCSAARATNLLVVADVKRGDIANTAQAYSQAFFQESTEIFGKTVEGFELDAITINPFLGLDTVEPFLNDCQKNNKGLFLLCKTSNSGAEELQNFSAAGKTLSQRVAEYANTAGEKLLGNSGYSSLGVVVGATYPEQAKALRELMPKNIFLIPGAGAQGADWQMACAGFDSKKSGAIINVSRALVKDLQSCTSANEFTQKVSERAKFFKTEILQALEG